MFYSLTDFQLPCMRYLHSQEPYKRAIRSFLSFRHSKRQCFFFACLASVVFCVGTGGQYDLHFAVLDTICSPGGLYLYFLEVGLRARFVQHDDVEMAKLLHLLLLLLLREQHSLVRATGIHLCIQCKI